MKYKYIVGVLGLITGFFMTTQTAEILCFEPETKYITVQYTDISRVSVKDFTDKEEASLNIKLKKEVGAYKGTVNYKNMSHPVFVEVVDQVAPIIKEVNGKYIGYDLLDGILECKIEGTKCTAIDKSGNKCEKTIPPKTKVEKEVHKKTNKVEQKVQAVNNTHRNCYSYRSLGNIPVLNKKLFGNDTDGLQKALESAGSYSVASEDTAFKYVQNLYSHYGITVPYSDNGKECIIQFGSVKESILNENSMYQKKVDELARTICGQGGDLYTLSMRICQYFRSHYTYVQGQSNASKLVSTGQGNCDSFSRLTIDILARYGLQGRQVSGNEHAWAEVEGNYIDPTFYITGNGENTYILSNTVWQDGQH